MKKIVSIFIMMCIVTLSVQAYEFKRVTNDNKINSALAVLVQTESHDTLRALYSSKKGVTKIMFYDLSLMGFEYRNHFAAASTDNFGQDWILINSKYRSAPKEAIAALIAHEVIHTLPQATMDEEVRATIAEAQQWSKSVSSNPALGNDARCPLIVRLNTLSQAYAQDGRQAIENRIASNSFYQRQLARQ
jgi:hypothetical protein